MLCNMGTSKENQAQNNIACQNYITHFTFFFGGWGQLEVFQHDFGGTCAKNLGLQAPRTPPPLS